MVLRKQNAPQKVRSGHKTTLMHPNYQNIEAWMMKPLSAGGVKHWLHAEY